MNLVKHDYYAHCVCVASFPGSPLVPMKNKNGGGEPGIDSHVISRQNDVTAITAKVVMQLCSISFEWLTRTATILLLKQVSCDCVGETSAWLKQQLHVEVPSV